MRIVLVLWGFERFGGMERHVVELAMGLQRAGADVSVVSEMPVARSNAYARDLRRAGVMLSTPPRWVWIAHAAHIALWPSPERKSRLIHGGGLLSWWLLRTLQFTRHPDESQDPFSAMAAGDRLAARTATTARATKARAQWMLTFVSMTSRKRRLGVSPGIDLIHIHGCRLGQAWLLDWAKASAIPTVYTEHVTIADAGGPLVAQAPAQARDAAVLACVSEHSRASLAEQFAAPPPIAITGHIVAAGAEPARTRPAGLQLLCPARLEPHKGVDIVLRAFALICAGQPDLRLVIAGSGRQGAELKRLCVALGIRARTDFTGMLSPARMAEAMATADMVVLASRSEALPLALLEALASAKPIIATRVGGIPDLIDSGKNGLLVPTDDVAALAAAIARLAADPDLRARLGASALSTFQHSRHHESRVIPEMLALYRQAARSTAVRRC